MDVRLIAGTLKRCHLFHELKSDELTKLGELVEVRLLSPGAAIFHAGEAGDSLFVIATGAVELFAVIDDEPRVLSTIEAGESFGELSLLLPGARLISARSVEEVTLIELDHGTMRMLEKSDPNLAVELLASLRERITPVFDACRPLLQGLFERSLQRALERA